MAAETVSEPQLFVADSNDPSGSLRRIPTFGHGGLQALAAAKTILYALGLVTIALLVRSPIAILQLKAVLAVLKFGGREGIRTPGLLVANSGENKLRQGATIT
ncbi:MAG: hypothetical protein DMG56_09920 [Acidobacteria bacterium]|nr:MAG: hypothetical protein DMG56_09920 [Acidobacteriota bacterium]